MIPQNEKAFAAFVEQWELQDDQVHQFRLYIDLLEQWNQRTNLISKNDLANIVSRHLSESLLFARLSAVAAANSLIDLGSGGGFPGIPIKIVHPELDVILIDSKRMKCLFLREVIDVLGLKKIAVICDRVESACSHLPAKSVDVVVARAVARLEKLWNWSKPLLAQDGCLITMKGGDVQEEITLLQKSDARVQVLVEEALQIGSETTRVFVFVKRR